jgi:tRNA threonylcarbamoyladenosine biosynthesis protein TsaB
VLVLAWDTSSPAASLALVRIGDKDSSKTSTEFFTETIAERVSDGRIGHSEYLPPMVSEVLREAGVSPRELSLLACGRGPGSFTGLRTGLALAKGLSMGASVPALGLGSLLVLAAGARLPESSLIAPLIDARHGEVFAALYRAGPEGEGLSELTPPAAVRPGRLGDFLANLAREGEKVTMVGPGLSLAPASSGPLLAAGDPAPPKAAVLAALAAAIFKGEGSGYEKMAGEENSPSQERRSPESSGSEKPKGHQPSFSEKLGLARAGLSLDPIYGRSPEIFKTWKAPARLRGGAA